MKRIIERKDMGGNLFLHDVHARVQLVLLMADYLSRNYHVVVANPPYMGSGGMNGRLAAWAKAEYPDSKADLFAMFMERALGMVRWRGLTAMINMQSWMFLSSYEKFREKILSISSIKSLVQIGYNTFPEINSKIAQGVAFVTQFSSEENPGYYINLNDAPQSADKEYVFLQKLSDYKQACFRPSIGDFKKITGRPIAYWASKKILSTFAKLDYVGERAVKGLDTNGNIDMFLKRWYEVGVSRISIVSEGANHWYPIAKGGEFRRWYGNNDFVINYSNNGASLKANKANLRSVDRYFREGLTWTVVSFGGFSVRYMPGGFIFDQGGCAIHGIAGDSIPLDSILASLNSTFAGYISELICPTLNFTTGDVRKFPIWNIGEIEELAKRCRTISQSDWDAYETSWDFATLPLLVSDYRAETLEGTYVRLRTHWREHDTGDTASRGRKQPYLHRSLWPAG